MKRKDWADKKAAKLTRQGVDALCSGLDDEPEEDDKEIYCYWLARALRAAEKRGYMRAVKLQRKNPNFAAGYWADWLEEQR